MPETAIQTDDKLTRRVPCHDPDCDGGETRYRNEPSYPCETCAGYGVLSWWSCVSCSRDYTCEAEMPAHGGSDGWECADCVRREALDGWDFAAVACSLRELRNQLCRSKSIDTPRIVGGVCGELRHLADRFAELARDLT